jgi:hypothetical protein
VDRYSELEDLRRSLAMLLPGSAALDREEAMALIAELQGVEERLRRLRDGVARVLREEGGPWALVPALTEYSSWRRRRSVAGCRPRPSLSALDP